MKTKIYEYSNDGVTYFKGNIVYSGGSGWELEVEIPDFLNPYETMTGDPAIEPENSFPQLLSECLRNNNGVPCLCVMFGKGAPCEKYYYLKVLSRKELNLAKYL